MLRLIVMVFEFESISLYMPGPFARIIPSPIAKKHTVDNPCAMLRWTLGPPYPSDVIIAIRSTDPELA